MAPGILSDQLPIHDSPVKSRAPHREPLKQTGALDSFKYEDTTPAIGREFIGVNIVDDLINANNADELLRDLAITSQFPYTFLITNTLTLINSLRTWRRLLPRPAQPNQRPPKALRPQARTAYWQAQRLLPPHPPSPQQQLRVRSWR